MHKHQDSASIVTVDFSKHRRNDEEDTHACNSKTRATGRDLHCSTGQSTPRKTSSSLHNACLTQEAAATSALNGVVEINLGGEKRALAQTGSIWNLGLEVEIGVENFASARGAQAGRRGRLLDKQERKSEVAERGGVGKHPG